MSLDGSGMICPACSIGQRSAQDKAGLRKTYVAGAIVLLPVVLYFLFRILRLAMHQN
jgi:hypothetical protein